MLAAYFSHPSMRQHEMGPGHPECPERLSAVQDRLLGSGLLDYMHDVTARPATREQIARVHDTLYIDELFAHSPAEGRHNLDPDTSMNPHTLEAALLAAGAAIEATDWVIQGQTQRAFCNVRPPGHHAERHQAMGFCFFNNVCAAMAHALEHHGLERVALIDFDVHHGNGSEDIFAGDDRVLMCSIFQTNFYPWSGEVPKGPNMVNVGLPERSRGEQFREAVTTRWLPALHAFRPQMLFISAGFDAHLEDDMGNLGLVEADYAWVTDRLGEVADQHAQGRIVSCLEGGYDLSSLARSACAHVKSLMGL
ncbi:histone deacetylase family protein [Amphibiibacter pelophylacis]|uniref:Histone deacetylase family protein n=1 Tax=Amphibiibacter pelophylacis TaxID=1799477 RepID=A0ACC6P1R5_9BURK